MILHSVKTCDILPIYKSDTLTKSKGSCPHSSPAPCGGTLPPGEGMRPSGDGEGMPSPYDFVFNGRPHL